MAQTMKLRETPYVRTDFNDVTISGRLTKDASTRVFANESGELHKASIFLECQEARTTPDGRVYTKKRFIPVSVNGNEAPTVYNIMSALKKDQCVYVTGEINTWSSGKGDNVTYHWNIEAYTIKLLEKGVPVEDNHTELTRSRVSGEYGEMAPGHARTKKGAGTGTR